MGLLAPWLVAGFAFIAVPWLIHRHRRPPRNPTPFSSLMFVPEAPPVTRAKKQIENPWLMALRMFLLALLALAFARPFDRVLATPDQEAWAASYHVVLVDVSASMAATKTLESRNNKLRDVLGNLAASDGVAVVAFDQQPRVIVPFPESSDGPVSRPGTANILENLPAPAGGTDIRAALERAVAMLQDTAAGEGESVRRTVHLISDLQRSGWDGDAASYELPGAISIELHTLDASPGENLSVDEMALVPSPETGLVVRARVRNYSPEPVRTSYAIVLDGARAEEQPLALPAAGSRMITWRAEVDSATPHTIAVVLTGEDALASDNARYVVYEPEPTRDIGLLVASQNAGSPDAERFLDAAVAESQPLPWRLRLLDADALTSETAPDVLVVLGGFLQEADVPLLEAFVSGGGHALLIPGTQGFGPAATAALLSPGGIAVAGRRAESETAVPYATFAWIDYDHPVFQNFREAAFSDFSMVRFQDFYTLDLSEEAGVLARLEGDQVGQDYPGLVTSGVGEGRLLVWAFPLDPAWTNLTRTRRFVPLLHESIELLLPPLPPARTWTTATSVPPPADWEPGAVILPGLSETVDAETAAERLLRVGNPGFLQWQGSDSVVTEAVNAPVAESDLARFKPDELLLRAGAPAIPEDGATAVASEGGQNIVHWEYGYAILAVLLVGYLLETGIAFWMGHQRGKES